jgi:hypothetical protein
MRGKLKPFIFRICHQQRGGYLALLNFGYDVPEARKTQVKMMDRAISTTVCTAVTARVMPLNNAAVVKKPVTVSYLG